MRSILAALIVVCGINSSASASSFRTISADELNTLNWILQCPAELSKAQKLGGEWIGSGTFFSDRAGSGYSYKFARRDGFTSAKYVTTLKVSRIVVRNPAADAPGFRVQCELVAEQE